MRDSYRRLAAAIGACAVTGGAGRFDRVVVVLNPRAGGIASRRKLMRAVEMAEQVCIRKAAPAALETAGVRAAGGAAIYLPDSLEDARNAVDETVADAAASEEQVLLLSAGGDGTHKEVVARLLAAGTAALSRVTVHRLPLGTGNDGADAPTLEASLLLLAAGGERRAAPAVRVVPRDGAMEYALNVASFGLDAYVSLVTNRLNGYVPGDTYKTVADLATLLYEPLVGVPHQEIVSHGRAGDMTQTNGRFMLCAVGASGRRSYGDGKPILPGNANVVAIKSVGLAGKLRLKRAVYAGTHLAEPEVVALAAREIEFSADHALPMQLDGEARWLLPAQFPVRCTVVPDAFSVLV